MSKSKCYKILLYKFPNQANRSTIFLKRRNSRLKNCKNSKIFNIRIPLLTIDRISLKAMNYSRINCLLIITTTCKCKTSTKIMVKYTKTNTKISNSETNRINSNNGMFLSHISTNNRFHMKCKDNNTQICHITIKINIIRINIPISSKFITQENNFRNKFSLTNTRTSSKRVFIINHSNMSSKINNRALNIIKNKILLFYLFKD